MDTLQVIWLALIQGLTEFLPISSSAHLILVPRILDWPDQGIAFDVAVHIGTLLAVVIYFRQDIATLSAHWLDSVRGRGMDAEAKLAWGVIIGTVPAALFGLFAMDIIETQLRAPQVIMITTILFGIVLWLADRLGKRVRNEYQLGWGEFVLIGCAQALALIPGTSRSGITMTAALLLGQDREAAARYSFLLSIPIILLSFVSVMLKLAGSTEAVDWQPLLIGSVIAFVSAYTCVVLFLKMISRIGMGPFALYRIALGALLFSLFGWF